MSWPRTVAQDFEASIDHAFTDKPLSERTLLTKLKGRLSNKPEYWRDTKFSYDFRPIINYTMPFL